MIDRLARHLLARQTRRSFYTWDSERLRRHQQKRIKKILEHVSRHAPYYRNMRTQGWDGRFESLPYLSKSELITHFDEINTAGLMKADLVEFAIQQERAEQLGLYRGRYSIGLSSGTSGTRLPTILSPWERWQYGSLLFARSGIPEHIHQPRVLFSLRVNNPAFMEASFLGVNIVYIDYTHPIEKIVLLVNEKRLNVLAGPPSLLRMVARHCRDIDHPIEALISYAEVLDDKSREQLQKDFNAPLAQIYQGAEGFIASTCRAGNLHLNEDVVYIEAIDTGDTLSNAKRLIVTDLYRKTLPFLRYQLNDIIEIGADHCSCGSSFRIIQRIHGRADDIFYLRGENGEMRFLFPDYVTRSINQASESIVEFQAIQHNPDQIEIRLQLTQDADRQRIENEIRRNLAYWAQKVGGNLGELIFSEALPERNLNSLKLIRVVRKF